MESVAFTQRFGTRQIIETTGNVSEYLLQVWERLNWQLATYLTENLPDNAYQLLQIRREVIELPGGRDFEARLILEVGQVTERPFVNVAVNPAWQEMTGEQYNPTPAPTSGWIQGQANPFGIFDAEYARRRRDAALAAIQDGPQRRPEHLPLKRHILIDKQQQPA